MLPRCPHSVRLKCLILFAVAAIAHAQPAHIQPMSSAAPQPVPIMVVVGLGRGTVALDGPWQFHTGDDAAWADPAFNDSHWEQLSAEKSWGAQTHPGYTGYAWYRRHIRIDPSDGTPSDIALLIPGVNDMFQLYWNGSLVGGQGRAVARSPWYRFRHMQTLGLGPAREGVLALRVWKAELTFTDPETYGGFTAPIEMGSPQAIAAAFDQAQGDLSRNIAFNVFLYSIYFLVGLAAFVLWLRDRSQMLFLWTACFLACVGMGSLIGLQGALPDSWRSTIMLATGATENIGLWYLLCWLLNLREHQTLMRLTRAAAFFLAAATIAFCFFTAVGSQALHGAAYKVPEAALSTIATVFGIWNMVPIAVAIFSPARLDRARWLFALASSFAQAIFITGSILGLGLRFTHVSIAAYSFRPLFHFFGSSMCLQNIADSLLLLTLLYAVYRFSAESRNRQAALEQEFQNARELQQMLIPDTLPQLPGFTLTSAYKPALEVGGDFFQIVPLQSGDTVIVLGDVSGKGLKAAMAVSLIVGMVRALAAVFPEPGRLLAEINDRLADRLHGAFATTIALRLDAQGNCAVASAGHLPPFINARELDLAGALPLGIAPGVFYAESKFHIEESDRLALYTDGLLEARNPSGDIYGFDRLRALFASNPTAEAAAQAAVQFGQDDDITVLSLTRLAVAKASAASHQGPALVPA
ncbi:MAG: SpoIIE family protein phosphatase [Terracidiphilus sp.]|jgi:hypothetical protein